MTTRRTTKKKSDLITSAIGKEERPERMTLAEGRDKLFENFYNNLRILCATQTMSAVELSRILGMKSGKRISDLCYGRGNPSAEELMVIASHFNCGMDDLLRKTAKICWI